MSGLWEKKRGIILDRHGPRRKNMIHTSRYDSLAVPYDESALLPFGARSAFATSDHLGVKSAARSPVRMTPSPSVTIFPSPMVTHPPVGVGCALGSRLGARDGTSSVEIADETKIA